MNTADELRQCAGVCGLPPGGWGKFGMGRGAEIAALAAGAEALFSVGLAGAARGAAPSERRHCSGTITRWVAPFRRGLRRT